MLNPGIWISHTHCTFAQDDRLKIALEASAHKLVSSLCGAQPEAFQGFRAENRQEQRGLLHNIQQAATEVARVNSYAR